MSQIQKKAKRAKANGQPRMLLHFLGAAQTVTGSLHFFEYSEEGKTTRFFVDMGIFQNDPSLNRKNRLPRGVKAEDIDFGIFTHAHNDHTGFFPRLVRDGFKGPVFATAATKDLAAVILQDSARLQEEEARQINARAEKGQRLKKLKDATTSSAPLRTFQALFDSRDVDAALSLFRVQSFDHQFSPAANIKVKFMRASHLLGAAMVEICFGSGASTRRVILTGDIGRPKMPVLKELAVPKHVDYLVLEGTYGARLHPKRDRLQSLAEMINKAYQRAKSAHSKFGYGVILIPAFAVGRVQSVLHDLRELMEKGKIPEIPVFVDSPMANRTTAIYRQHSGEYNAVTAAVARRKDPFRTSRYAEITEASQSERLGESASEPIIILSSSGMASGGRVVHHLQRRLPGEQNTVLFVGFQAEGTFGRQLMESKGEKIRLMGEELTVRAYVDYLEDYSGHADYEDTLNWLSKLPVRPKRIFLVHGDLESLSSLKEKIEHQLRIDVLIPGYRDQVELGS